MSDLEKALAAAVEAAVSRALDAHLPKLTIRQGEVAEMLGVSPETVGRLVGEGKLTRITGPQGPITLASVLELAGWPLTPAPLSSPLSAVPDRQANPLGAT